MRQIRLYGELGKRFGKSYNLCVKTPAEAIRALSVLLDGFESFLFKSQENNIGFKVFNGKVQADESDLKIESTGVIKIVPVLLGGNGEAKILAGAVLIAAGSIITATTGAATVGAYFINAGIGMVVAGSVQLLAGKMPSVEPHEKSDSKPSYVFAGAVNTQAQGQAVPVGYGRHIVGSAVISAAISNVVIKGG